MDKTFEELIQDLMKHAIDCFFIAESLRTAHNQELRSLRDRVIKLEDQLRENGFEAED